LSGGAAGYSPGFFSADPPEPSGGDVVGEHSIPETRDEGEDHGVSPVERSRH
jgi:hypothetical protein